MPRVSVSRARFVLTNDLDRAYFGRGGDRSQVGVIDDMHVVFGRTRAAEPDRLIEQLRHDEAVAEAVTLLLIVRNRLAVAYCAS